MANTSILAFDHLPHPAGWAKKLLKMCVAMTILTSVIGTIVLYVRLGFQGALVGVALWLAQKLFWLKMGVTTTLLSSDNRLVLESPETATPRERFRARHPVVRIALMLSSVVSFGVLACSAVLYTAGAHVLFIVPSVLAFVGWHFVYLKLGVFDENTFEGDGDEKGRGKGGRRKSSSEDEKSKPVEEYIDRQRRMNAGNVAPDTDGFTPTSGILDSMDRPIDEAFDT